MYHVLFPSACDFWTIPRPRTRSRTFVAGVEEKDINVNLDGNQLVISGEKREDTKKDEKDWHIEERCYGSFYRSMSLPFKPEDRTVEAHLDKGILHVNIKKPAEVAKSVKTIEIKPGAPTKAAG
jgi:HSP20 family protein